MSQLPIFAAGQDAAVGAVAVSLVKGTARCDDDSVSDALRSLAAGVTRELGGRQFGRW